MSRKHNKQSDITIMLNIDIYILLLCQFSRRLNFELIINMLRIHIKCLKI